MGSYYEKSIRIPKKVEPPAQTKYIYFMDVMDTTTQHEPNEGSYLALAHILQAHKVRPSPQRLAVYKYLHGVKTHPSADTIYHALSEDFPTLSRTTVYQTLEALYSCGLIKKFSDNLEMRFDVNIKPHGHFKCLQCGSVFDFSWPENTILPQPPEEFKTEETLIFYRGICPACRKESERGNQ